MAAVPAGVEGPQSGQEEELERESLIASENDEDDKPRNQFRESNVRGACSQLLQVADLVLVCCRLHCTPHCFLTTDMMKASADLIVLMRQECRIAVESTVETGVPKAKEYRLQFTAALREKGMFEPIATPCHLLLVSIVAPAAIAAIGLGGGGECGRQ